MLRRCRTSHRQRDLFHPPSLAISQPPDLALFVGEIFSETGFVIVYLPIYIQKSDIEKS
jgi:hypothetical protein